MDIEEKSVLTSARIRGATYPGDKIEALKDAYKIAEEDSVVAGVNFLELICEVLKDAKLRKEEVVYKILNKVFEGKGGSEFIEIFFKNTEGTEIFSSYLVDPVAEELPELEKMIMTLAKEKRKKICEVLMQSSKQNEIFEQAENGKEIVLDVVRVVIPYSVSLRKFLIFRGFVESLMNLALRSKEREVSRKAVSILSEMMETGAECAGYFLELRWKDWLAKILERHPLHGCSFICSISQKILQKEELSFFLPFLVSLKELAGIYHVTLYSQDARELLLKEPLQSSYKRLADGARSSECPTRCNLVLGIENNLYQKTRLPKGEIGDLFYLATHPNGQTPEEKSHRAGAINTPQEEIELFLYGISSISSKSPTASAIYFKTAVVEMLNNKSSLFYSTEIVHLVKEISESEDAPSEIHAIASFWLICLYVILENADHEEFPDVLKDIDRIALESNKFLVSLLNGHSHPPFSSQCETGTCKRCYYSEISSGGSFVPLSTRALTNPLWLPQRYHERIFSKYTEYLKTASKVVDNCSAAAKDGSKDGSKDGGDGSNDVPKVDNRSAQPPTSSTQPPTSTISPTSSTTTSSTHPAPQSTNTSSSSTSLASEFVSKEIFDL